LKNKIKSYVSRIPTEIVEDFEDELEEEALEEAGIEQPVIIEPDETETE
jgi:hypothetical protein